MTWRRRHLAQLLLALLPGCSSDGSSSSAPDDPLNVADVIYVGSPTDEALLHLLDAAPQDVPQKYVVLDSPDTSAPVPKDAPATLSFHPASQASRTLPGARTPTNRDTAWRHAWRSVGKLLSPIGTAHAHGVPYNGTAYFLVVSDAASHRLLRVFTNQTSYTPDAKAWQRLAAAPQPLTLVISSAFFEENQIPDDGGPFVGGTFRFELE